MVHGLNPFGFAHLRRVNEDNVDLNRNFVDHAAPHPANPAYETLADAIAPTSCSALATAGAFARLRWYGLVHGRSALRTAISGGKYSHPDGLFFGGRSEAWSNRTFHAIVARHLRNATRAAFVDIHTGLGPFGYGEIITGEPKGSPAYERAAAWWGERTKSVKTDESASIDVTGAIKLSLHDPIPGTPITAVSVEFGTFPAATVLRAMRAENWLHHHGGRNHPRAKAITAEMRRVFYPDTADWKDQVWRQGRAVVDQALAGLSTDN